MLVAGGWSHDGGGDTIRQDAVSTPCPPLTILRALGTLTQFEKSRNAEGG